MNKNYEILQLSDSEIKNLDIKSLNKKYKELARLYHPDRPEGDDLKFKEINMAYNKVKKYINSSEFDSSDPYKLYTEKVINKGEYFKTIFSQLKNIDIDNCLSNFMSYTNELKYIYDKHKCREKTEDTIINVKVTLEDIFNNEDKIITLKRTRHCENCIVNDLKFCLKCNNKQYVEKEKGFIFSCSECIIIFNEQGNEEKNKRPGDIIVKISSKIHDKFKRLNENDIVYEINYNKLETLNHSFVYLDNKEYTFNATYPWRKEYIIKNKGLPVPYSDNKGDLIIKVNYIPEDTVFNMDSSFELTL